MSFRGRRLLSGAGALLISLPVVNAAAAEQSRSTAAATVGEVVVTAEKRPERVSNLPIAISAYSGETLSNAGVHGVRDLETLAPSLEITNKGTETYISIRGIGTQVASIGSEAGVTVSQDGVVFARDLFFDTDFLDIQRVEVLRGPQGTISGRNSTGGAINIISNRPTDKSEGGLELTAGNYSRFRRRLYQRATLERPPARAIGCGLRPGRRLAHQHLSRSEGGKRRSVAWASDIARQRHRQAGGCAPRRRGAGYLHAIDDYQPGKGAA